MCILHFVYPSISGLLDCFDLLAVINNAAICMDVQISLWDPALNSFGYILRDGIGRSYGSSILIFWGIAILFSIMAAPFYIPTNSAQRFQFLHILPNTCYFLFCLFVCSFCFDSSHPNVCKVISHCSFDLHFSNN